jgi:hypothetical protein
VLGVLGGIWGVLGAAMMGWVPAVPGQPTDFLESLKRFRPWLLLAHGCAIPVAILLLIAGIGIVQRRRWSMTLALLWCFAKVLLVVGTTFVTYLLQTAQFHALAVGRQGSAPLPSALSSSIINASVIVGTVLSIAWGWALPIFLIVWLLRTPIRRETRGWR